MAEAMRGGGVVLRLAGAATEHERLTHDDLARRIAALSGADYGGELEPERPLPARAYYVPSETLLAAQARALGIRGRADLFGGVVPHPHVATKSITHPLVDARACVPRGWMHGFVSRVASAVLPGYSAFSAADARRAGFRLLARGPVRLKPARATGGNHQIVVADLAALDAALEVLDPDDLASCGLALEVDLYSALTLSVGQVEVAGRLVSYYGTQRLTPNHRGAMVYGGSDLMLVRGGFEALLALDLPPELRMAIEQARRYDAAAASEVEGFIASRRNYDVLQGYDADGVRRSGVLEQSWRIGGASTAEIAALEVFAAEPGLRAVRACAVEEFGSAAPPPAATVHYRGVDPRSGPLVKYSLVEPRS